MIIETLILQAADLDTLCEFYGDRLGLPVVQDSASGSLTITIGESLLVFEDVAGFTGKYHFAFNIPENRLWAAQKFLETRGIALLTDSHGKAMFDFESWDAHALYFLDPAGNIVECIARHELPNAIADAETLPFTPSELLTISEIGLPTDNVPVLAALLSDHLEIRPYRETSPAFMPLGDAHGLLILVPGGRIWFPDTGIAAEILPVQVVFQDQTGARFAVQGVPYQITAISTALKCRAIVTKPTCAG